MKKINKLFASFILATLVLVGCANQVNDVIVEETNPTVNGTREVLIEVSSGTNEEGVSYLSFGNNTSTSRSILPGAIDANGTGIKYYIVGTNTVTNKSLTTGDKPEAIEFTADAGADAKRKGTVTKVFEKSSYSLILAAVTTANETNAKASRASLLQYASLLAYADVDFRYTENLSFYLMPNKESTANKGKVELSIYAFGWDPTDTDHQGYKIEKVGIYGLDDDSSATPKLTDTSFFSAAGIAIDTFPKTKPAQANFKPSGTIAAGKYNFTIVFKDSNNHQYEYSEDIQVLNNQTTIADVKVLDVIGKKPAAPTDFCVGYIDPSTDKENSEYYNVEFVWKDNAVNENYYELETLQITAADLPLTTWNSTNPGVWNTDTNWTTFVSDLSSSATLKIYNPKGGNTPYSGSSPSVKFSEQDDNYVSGKLTKSKTSVRMKYALGTRYLARIRAVNDAGESDWAYVNLTSGTGLTSGVTAFATGSKTINRYKLSYNTNGGEWENNGGSDPDLVTFHTQGATTILNPKKPAGSELALFLTINGTKNYWVRWLNADDTPYNAENVAPTNWDGFTNLSLYADYNASTTADVTIYNPSDYGITDEMIKIYVKSEKDSGASTQVTPSNKAFKVNISQHKAIVFELSSSDITYDLVKVGIKKTYGNSAWLSDGVKQNPSKCSVVKDITSYTTGTYLVTFYAYKGKSSTPYTYYMLMELQEGAVGPVVYLDASDTISVAYASSKTQATLTSSATDTITYTWYYADSTTIDTTSDTLISGITVDTITEAQMKQALKLASKTTGTYYFYATAKDSKNTVITPNASASYAYTVVYLESTNTVTITDDGTTKMTATIGGTTPTSNVTYTWYFNSSDANTGGTQIKTGTDAEVTYSEIRGAASSISTGNPIYVYVTITDDNPGTAEVITSSTPCSSVNQN